MKNSSYANSMCSLKGSNLNETSYLSRSNRSMVPILTSDFESRIMLNSKLPHKKSLSEEIRKNDFIVDNSYYSKNESKSSNILMNCLHDNNSDFDENLKKLKYKDECTNDSIKSLISESFKTFNLIDIDKSIGSSSITKTTSQQNIKNGPTNKENVNYIKPWVENCKYYSTNSLVYKKNNLVGLDKSTLSVYKTTERNNFNNNNNNLVKNIETNNIIKNIEFKRHDDDKENYSNLLKLNFN